MARYNLTNPKPGGPGDLLVQKGQAGTTPIYKGRDSNDFYVLKVGAEMKRYLVPFDQKTGEEIEGTQYPVADDWEGEPEAS